jgi:uncharacterized membrane protein YeaQ/YmgE (transglycosylase-associated protein family)
MILFRGPARSVPLIFAWTVALGGILLRMLYFDRLPNIAGILIFLVLGWGGAVTAAVVWHRFGWRFVRSAVLAGLVYTIGAISLLAHRPMIVDGFIGPHELWHLAVLSGLGLHWNFVFKFASGLRPGTQIWRLPGLIPVDAPEMTAVHSEYRPSFEPLHSQPHLSSEEFERPAA